MSPAGESDLLVEARSALLDALEALAGQLEALTLIGAQAVYLHTGNAPVALAEATKDTDVAVDPRKLEDVPLIDQAMRDAKFFKDLVNPQPGTWFNAAGIPIDLMVAEQLAGPAASGRRGARIPPHDKSATRRAVGLEAAMVDRAPMTIVALDPDDPRTAVMNVAGPAALLVAKLHKLGERQATPNRLVDKDAHDVYRLLVAIPTATLVAAFRVLLDDELSAPVTGEAVEYLEQMFGGSGTRLGSSMAGRAEELVGDPGLVENAVTLLAEDLLAGLR